MKKSFFCTTLHYIIVHTGDLLEGTSSFYEYPLNILSFAPLIKKISTLPSTFFELFSSKEEHIRLRMSNMFNGHAVSIFQNSRNINSDPFVIKILLSINPVQCNKTSNDSSILIKTSIKNGNESSCMPLEELNINTLREVIKSQINDLSVDYRDFYERLLNEIGVDDSDHCIKYRETIKNNIYTAPNVLLKKFIRIDFDEQLEMLGGVNSDSESIFKSIQVINLIKYSIRKNFHRDKVSPFGVDFIITDMSIDPIYIGAKPQDITSHLELSDDEKGNFFDALKRVSNGFNVDELALQNSYIHEYLAEEDFVNSLLALKAAIFLSPVIKYKGNTRDNVLKLRILGKNIRSGDLRKVNRLARDFRCSITENFLNLSQAINTEFNHTIKIVSNLPLEWMTCDKTPLMIRHDVSRIPLSPGYLSYRLLIDGSDVVLRLSDIFEITIISSFCDGDIIKNHLTDAVNVVQSISDLSFENFKGKDVDLLKNNVRNLKKVSIKYKSVRNANELIDVLKGGLRSIVVFDLHGGHGDAGMGYLQLTDEVIYPHEFFEANSIKVPPIVILSSCDTSPIDKNPYTTASAFFLAGAKTVIASALPINSTSAAEFVARLIVRIEHLAPLFVEKLEVPLSWSSIVSGMIRRKYYSELVFALGLHLKKKQSLILDTIHSVGLIIDPPRKKWIEGVMLTISNKFDIGPAELADFIEINFQFTECLRYLQLGNPESIKIVPGNVVIDSVDKLTD